MSKLWVRGGRQRPTPAKRPSGRAPGWPSLGAEDGFAAVDALVALTLLCMTIGLSLGAAQVARHAARAASETRAADSLLRGLIESQPNRLATDQGQGGDFDWRFAMTPMTDAGPLPPLALCQRSAAAVSRSSGRGYYLTTVTPCPLAVAG